MPSKPCLWGMTDEEIIEELSRFAYWWDAAYTTNEQRALGIIAEALRRILKKGKK